MNTAHTVTAILLNLSMGIIAYWRKSVDLSGFITGVITGTIIFLCGGWRSWIILCSFFVSSSILSHLKHRLKESIESMHQRGSQRDWIQVLANCGGATVFSIGYFVSADIYWLISFVTAFAASNADTWASEIGVLSHREPVSIISLRPVPRGTSGAVSPLGLFASLCGSAFITTIYIFINDQGFPQYHLIIVSCLILSGGFMGSIIDSILGATLQSRYRCEISGSITEKTVSMGRKTTLIRGYRIMNNDMVNLISSLAASTIAIISFALLLSVAASSPITRLFHSAYFIVNNLLNIPNRW